jgi:phospholipid transport system substrate-binding protein
LKQLVQRAYRKNLDRTLDYDVTFDGTEQQSDRVVVRTTAQNRKNAREEPISIDYSVHKVSGAWRINDIVTEGSSLVANYQQQFNRIIKKDGFAELLRRMKKRLASGSNET